MKWTVKKTNQNLFNEFQLEFSLILIHSFVRIKTRLDLLYLVVLGCGVRNAAQWIENNQFDLDFGMHAAQMHSWGRNNQLLKVIIYILYVYVYDSGTLKWWIIVIALLAMGNVNCLRFLWRCKIKQIKAN